MSEEDEEVVWLFLVIAACFVIILVLPDAIRRIGEMI